MGVARMVVLVVMGVCGCGKSTVGQALGKEYGVPFCDADDLHPASNVAKMSRGDPLTDQDRLPWLIELHSQLVKWEYKATKDNISCEGMRCVRGVMACSALKQQYRDILTGTNQLSETGIKILFIYLQGTREILMKRLISRKDHFMPTSLLDSQLRDLEEPKHSSVTVDIQGDVATVLCSAKEKVEVYLACLSC